MSEQSSKSALPLLSILTSCMVLAVDLFIFALKPQTQAIPHLGLAVLVAQLLSLLVFYKGEICPGQRGRLVKVNLAFALYWIVWMVVSLLPDNHHTLTNIMSLCGLSVVYFIWKQSKVEKARNSFLLMAILVAGLGGLSYFILFSRLPLSAFAEYNLIAPILAGVVLTNLGLVIAKNRLQNFIALLPLLMIVLLTLNALAMLIFLIFIGLQSAFNPESIFAYTIYFICHFVIAAILVIHSFQKWTLGLNTLFILLFISVCLPLWMVFV
ncbi:hypothetical protein BKG95_08095 [Rodentibacter pneumotropicus]|uniref:Gamma-glutamyl phosphate reductase n=1 Tax=Rodentibacter pneumotropicus TaxID=758 RepID=A0AAW5LCA0_9PAST|nr:hypothetical protein [Rodentibacter pneumotropicus]MCQ9121111.1 hypothetical protein [Rodentibacter pneumotropicus]OOF67303.1 hypothetical protein BKG95_08095 [Rodentibacter pneumotropicus]